MFPLGFMVFEGPPWSPSQHILLLVPRQKPRISLDVNQSSNQHAKLAGGNVNRPRRIIATNGRTETDQPRSRLCTFNRMTMFGGIRIGGYLSDEETRRQPVDYLMCIASNAECSASAFTNSRPTPSSPHLLTRRSTVVGTIELSSSPLVRWKLILS